MQGQQRVQIELLAMMLSLLSLLSLLLSMLMHHDEVADDAPWQSLMS